MVSESIQLLEFLIENIGVLSTIFLLIVLLPIIMVFLMWRLISSLLKNTDKKIDSIGTTLNNLNGSVKGMVEIIKLVVFGNSGNIPGNTGNSRDESEDEQ